MVLKLDMMKAYDRMDWQFIDKALKAWCFLEEVWKLVLSCVTIVEFSLLINGSVSKEIKPTRGLRQGDLLSPFLFILSSKILSRLIRKKEEAEVILGIKVHKNAPAISHLMYAEDLLIMCRANLEEAERFLRCLKTYCD